MFDSKEIARRAMARAEELRDDYRRLDSRRRTAVSFVICMAGIFIAVMAFAVNRRPAGLVGIDDEWIPLAAPAVWEYAEQENGPSFVIPGYDIVTVPAGASHIDMTLPNPEGNRCNFTFAIILEETGETLYESELVAPSEDAGEVTLNKPLEKGEYAAKLVIQAFGTEESDCSGRANVTFKLVVT